MEGRGKVVGRQWKGSKKVSGKAVEEAVKRSAERAAEEAGGPRPPARRQTCNGRCGRSVFGGSAGPGLGTACTAPAKPPGGGVSTWPQFEVIRAIMLEDSPHVLHYEPGRASTLLMHCLSGRQCLTTRPKDSLAMSRVGSARC